jgi:hypothetical protein
MYPKHISKALDRLDSLHKEWEETKRDYFQAAYPLINKLDDLETYYNLLDKAEAEVRPFDERLFLMEQIKELEPMIEELDVQATERYKRICEIEG